MPSSSSLMAKPLGTKTVPCCSTKPAAYTRQRQKSSGMVTAGYPYALHSIMVQRFGGLCTTHSLELYFNDESRGGVFG